jgi:hypothetical protein
LKTVSVFINDLNSLPEGVNVLIYPVTKSSFGHKCGQTFKLTAYIHLSNGGIESGMTILGIGLGWHQLRRN